MKKALFALIALIACGTSLLAQGTLQTTNSVIRILSEDTETGMLLIAADLSATEFEEDLSGVSQILLVRSSQVIQLDDFGANGDVTKGDRIYTATFSAGTLSVGTITAIATARSMLTTGAFTFNLVSDFGANPPLPKDLKIQKIIPADSKGRTVKIIADMSAAASILGDRKIFNIQIGDLSARFRDDGKFNDQTANDMMFTASLRATDAEIQNFITTNATAVKLNGATKTTFVGRSLVPAPVVAFDSATFNAGRVTTLKALTPFVVNASNLSAIRDKSLMVKDLSATEDLARTYDPLPPARGNENGAWSFGKLIAGVAGKSNPEDALQFLIAWVDTKLFSAASNVSGDTCRERSVSKATFIRAWLTNSGVKLPATGLPANWKAQVKVSRFPVRLLAIINRLDLRGNLAFGLSNVGEGRFVFCFVDSTKNGAFGGSVDASGSMTIILEYGLPLKDCDQVEAYVKGWFNLKDQAWGPVFNQKLQALTDQFTAQNAAPERQNGSALNHLRSNEFLQSKKTAPANGHDWEIRDFTLSSNALEHTWKVSPGKEPGAIWNGPVARTPLLQDLVAFVNGLDFTKDFDVPDNLRAISAPMPVTNAQGKANGLIWVGSSAIGEVMKPANRREFSLQTCTGCHSAETRITPFIHVKPRSRGVATVLSSFMVGPSASTAPAQLSQVLDPVAGSLLPPKQFNDALRRAIDLADLFFNFKCVPDNPIGPIGGTLLYAPLNNDH